MKIGILTSGGDCPGLNAVIRGAVLKGDRRARPRVRRLPRRLAGRRRRRHHAARPPQVRGLSKQGGTILGIEPHQPVRGRRRRRREHRKHVMDDTASTRIIAIGGEGTLAAAKRLTDAGIKIVGVPKTIDNDLAATDYSFGFDTAVEIATEAMDRLRTTGDSHGRCMVAEVMGRHVGWIALHSGMAGRRARHPDPRADEVDRADLRLGRVGARPRSRPARSSSRRASQLDTMDDAHSRQGSRRVRPSAPRRHRRDARPEIEARTGIETRATMLGHIQRGGRPDRLRPRARHAPRHGGDRRRLRGTLGLDGRRSRHRHRQRQHRGCARRPEDRSAVPLRRGGATLRLMGCAGLGSRIASRRRRERGRECRVSCSSTSTVRRRT